MTQERLGSLEIDNALSQATIDAQTRKAAEAEHAQAPAPMDPSGKNPNNYGAADKPVSPVPPPTGTQIFAPLLDFKLGIALQLPSGEWTNDARWDEARIELAPARRSFHDKAGQNVPGTEAGIVHQAKANLVRLAVPASRPIYQHLGIREETLDWVGAFVGFDNGPKTEQNENRKYNAWVEYMDVKSLLRSGREVIVTLNWGVGHKYQFHYPTGAKPDSAIAVSQFRGMVKYIDVEYATAQRVYYRICMHVSNREDILVGSTSTENAYKAIACPVVIAGSLQLDKDFQARLDQSKAQQAAEAAAAKAANAAEVAQTKMLSRDSFPDHSK